MKWGLKYLGGAAMASRRAVRRGRWSTSALGQAAVFSGERSRWEGRRPASDGDACRGRRRAAFGLRWSTGDDGLRWSAVGGLRQAAARRPAAIGGRRSVACGGRWAAMACGGRRAASCGGRRPAAVVGLWRSAVGSLWRASDGRGDLRLMEALFGE
jgi:hypothetical protein